MARGGNATPGGGHPLPVLKSSPFFLMQIRKQHLLAHILLPILIFTAFAARAQEDPKSKKAARIQLRVLYSQPVEGASDLKIIQSEATLTELSLLSSMVSDPFGVGRGEIVLARRTADGKEPNPVLKLSIPAVGNRFALTLFPNPRRRCKGPITAYPHPNGRPALRSLRPIPFQLHQNTRRRQPGTKYIHSGTGQIQGRHPRSKHRR